MLIDGAGREFIIKDTHRGLYYEDGKLTRVLEAGWYRIPPRRQWLRRLPRVECLLVDVRERELTIKGQEILTSDKVAIRVSILVQFRVTDPTAAIHTVDNFEDRIYSDVQLAARRSLASMTLEEILTNRNRLSEEILSDVKESATGYGVAIRRADVKDLIFPGNLQEIMNRVLAAERNSQAQLVEARTRAEVEEIQARSNAETSRREAEAEARRLRELANADALRVRAEAEARACEQRVQSADALVIEQAEPGRVGLASLATLHRLKRLWLEGIRTSSSEWRHLSALTQLERLSLQGCSISDNDLRHVAKMAELKQLLLKDTRINNSGVSHLAHLKKLEHLSLPSEQLTSDCLRQLTDLNRLEFLDFRAKLDDEALLWLTQLPQLERLNTKQYYGLCQSQKSQPTLAVWLPR